MKNLRATALLVMTMFAVVWAGKAAAQDTNWWSQQYGTRAELLGGAVVGSFLDLSSTYYNPGAISLIENPQVLLSAKAFEYTSLTLENGRGVGEDLSASSLGSAPTLFTGLFPSGWLKGQLAYSALTRQDFDVRVTGRILGEGDVSAVVAGDEDYAAEVFFDQNLTENWYGATWSYAPKKNLGIGVTLYGVYRGQRTRVQTIGQVAATPDTGATAIIIDEFAYQHYRLVAKVGLALDYSPLQLGFALTTPGLGAFGGGSAYFNRSFTAVDTSGLVADDQRNLDANYKSPMSIAGGASYRWERTAVHFSAEWFNGVDKYEVLDTRDLPKESPGASISSRVTHELDPVLKFGLGVEHQFRENLHGYGSFVTDFTAAVPGTDTKHTISNWDIYHVLAGAAFDIKGLDLTLGVSYAFGREAFNSVVESPFDASIGSKIVYQRWKFIVGFAFTL